jgi:hypothetical protein
MRLICFAVAISFFSTLVCEAQTVVRSTPGAHCTVTHQGKVLDDFVMPYFPNLPRSDNERTLHFAVIPHLYPSVVVTCSKAGFKTRSVVLSPERMRTYTTAAPCGARAGTSPQQLEAICGDYDRRAAKGARGWTVDYPFASVYLEREDKK